MKADPKDHTATVTFETDKTNIDEMKKALAKDDYAIEGEPQFLN